MAKLSERSNYVLRCIAEYGGSMEGKGNWREGRALISRGLARKRGTRLELTAKGRKFIENQ